MWPTRLRGVFSRAPDITGVDLAPRHTGGLAVTTALEILDPRPPVSTLVVETVLRERATTGRAR